MWFSNNWENPRPFVFDEAKRRGVESYEGVVSIGVGWVDGGGGDVE